MDDTIRLRNVQIHRYFRMSGVDDRGDMWVTPDFDYFLTEPEHCALCGRFPRFDVYINVADGRVVCSEHIVSEP